MYVLMLLLLIRIGSASIPISLDKRALFSDLASSSMMASILYPVSFFTNFNITLLPFYARILEAIVYALALLYSGTLTSFHILFLCSLLPSGKRSFPKLEHACMRMHELVGSHLVDILLEYGYHVKARAR